MRTDHEHALNDGGYRTRKVTLVTTLLDCDRYPVKALVELYHARQQVTNLRRLRQRLGMCVMKSGSEAGVRRELPAFGAGLLI